MDGARRGRGISAREFHELNERFLLRESAPSLEECNGVSPAATGEALPTLAVVENGKGLRAIFVEGTIARFGRVTVKVETPPQNRNWETVFGVVDGNIWDAHKRLSLRHCVPVVV